MKATDVVSGSCRTLEPGPQQEGTVLSFENIFHHLLNVLCKHYAAALVYCICDIGTLVTTWALSISITRDRCYRGSLAVE